MFNVKVTGQNPADAKAKTAAAIANVQPPLGPIESQLAPSIQAQVDAACDVMTAAGFTYPVSVRINSNTQGNGVNLSVVVDAWDFINP